MSVLNHLALFAAMLLLIELIVLILVLLGVAGGLGFGLHWGRGKVSWGSEKANTYLRKGTHFLYLGLNYGVLPVIKISAFMETLKGTAIAIRRRIGALQMGRSGVVVQPTPHMLAQDGTRGSQTPAALPEPATVIEPRPHMLAQDETEISPLPR